VYLGLTTVRAGELYNRIITGITVRHEIVYENRHGKRIGADTGWNGGRPWDGLNTDVTLDPGNDSASAPQGLQAARDSRWRTNVVRGTLPGGTVTVTPADRRQRQPHRQQDGGLAASCVSSTANSLPPGRHTPFDFPPEKRTVKLSPSDVTTYEIINGT